MNEMHARYQIVMLLSRQLDECYLKSRKLDEIITSREEISDSCI